MRENVAMPDIDDTLLRALGNRERTDRLEQQARPSAVLVPLFKRDDAWHVLLTRRTEHLATHKGQIAFPGGKVDPADRDPIETALREAEEEIGLARRDVRVLGLLDDLITLSQWRITPVVGVIPHPYAFAPSQQELSEIFDVPLAFLTDPANLTVTTRDSVLPGPPIEVYHFYYRHYDIWGATARILRQLIAIIA
jgi:8-oxo-dGTP pyrophosphatase MutT (NUDIX family)